MWFRSLSVTGLLINPWNFVVFDIVDISQSSCSTSFCDIVFFTVIL